MPNIVISKIIMLILLALVALDASGDAFKERGWQLPSHAMESIQVVGWILIWALFGFKSYYVVMYILGRIWLFDPVHNLWKGQKLFYVGGNDLIGKIIKWLATWWKTEEEIISFCFKILALIWWVAWFITNGDGR